MPEEQQARNQHEPEPGYPFSGVAQPWLNGKNSKHAHDGHWEKDHQEYCIEAVYDHRHPIRFVALHSPRVNPIPYDYLRRESPDQMEMIRRKQDSIGYKIPPSECAIHLGQEYASEYQFLP